MFCAFLSSFSPSFSGTLSLIYFTNPLRGCLGVSHCRIFFFFFPPHCHLLSTPKPSAQNAPEQPPGCISLVCLFTLSPTELLSHAFGFLLFFLHFFFFLNWGELLTRLRRSLADCTCDSRASEGFSAELSERENPRFWKRRRRPGGCSAALTLWFLRCRRFVSPPRCNGGLNQEDSFWSQALQDLQTCGQSEILRELEVGHPHPPTHFLCPK